MSANVRSMIAQKDAWHHEGNITGKFERWSDIESQGGLDYSCFKSQSMNQVGQLIDSYGIYRWDLANKLALAKATTQAEILAIKRRAVYLGSVGKDYEVIHHSTGFHFSDAVVNAANGAHYAVAGSLGKGEVVWGLIDLSISMRVGDDATKMYLLFVTSYDGSISWQVRLTGTRVVCQNTLDMALREKTKGMFRVKHTKNAHSRIEDAKAALSLVTEDIVTAEQKLNFLAGRRVTRKSYDAIMAKLFPVPKKDDGTDGDSSTRRTNILSQIAEIYDANDGNAYPEQRGTGYNLLNAITHFADHYRASKSDKDSGLTAESGRHQSAMFGSGLKLKTTALDLIMGESENMLPMRQSIPVSSFADIGLNVRN